jgi:Effector-associated domain 2
MIQLSAVGQGPMGQGGPMFAAAVVAWLVAVLGDRALNGVTRVVLGPPDQRALAEALSVAFGVAFEGVPESSREALSSALGERFTEPPAIVLDGRTRVRTGLLRAVQAQIAPLAEAGIGPAGRSFFDEIDVDAARVRDDLSAVVIRSIEQVGASSAALSPLVNQLNADAMMEQVEAVLSRLGSAAQVPADTAVGAAASPARRARGKGSARPGPAGPGGYSAEIVQRLTDALLQVPAVADDDSRRMVLQMLPADLRLAIPHSRVPRIHVLGMVSTSWDYADGLTSLVRAVRLVEGDSLRMDELDSVILELAGPAESGAQDGRGGDAG